MDIHIPVMLQEALKGLAVEQGSVFVDATFGRGGHSRAILERMPKDGLLLAFDRDVDAVEYGLSNIKDFRFKIFHKRFSQIGEVAKSVGVYGQIDGILFDLGVSSPQLDEAERGFSFQQSGPLDMRMDRTQPLTAANWLAKVSENQLAKVIADYGEERYCKSIARAIVMARSRESIEDTERLAQIVKAAHPHWEKGKHPATRTFQAIRIAVNQELEELEAGLEAAWRTLRIGGRMAVISFHSLEDRLVKGLLGRYSGRRLPVDLPVKYEDIEVKLRSVGKALKASAGEVAANVRARSAIMRVIERVG